MAELTGGICRRGNDRLCNIRLRRTLERGRFLVRCLRPINETLIGGRYGSHPAIMPNRETLYHVADRVATITLNRPDKLNAWTAIMEGEVRAAMGEAEQDEN